MSHVKEKFAIISGATSVVGNAIQKRLLSKGYSLVSISRNDISNNSKNNQHICLDLTKPLSTQKGFETLKQIIANQTEPSLLVHSAPIWLLPAHIEDLKPLGVERCIVFSSSSIEGKSKSPSTKEIKTINALNDSERLCKHYCSKLNVDLTIFRPTMIYGYGKGENIAFIANILKKFRFFPITFKANGLRRPVHVDDLAQAVEFAADQSNTFGKTYNLSGAEELSYRDMVKRIADVSETNGIALPIPGFLYRGIIWLTTHTMRLFKKNLDIDTAMVARMQDDLNFDSDAARTDFAYSPSHFLPNGKIDLFGE